MPLCWLCVWSRDEVVRGQSYPSVMLKPDVEGQTLLEVAQALITLPQDGKC